MQSAVKLMEPFDMHGCVTFALKLTVFLNFGIEFSVISNFTVCQKFYMCMYMYKSVDGGDSNMDDMITDE